MIWFRLKAADDLLPFPIAFYLESLFVKASTSIADTRLITIGILLDS
jgi:hypothetical protein